MVDIEKAKLLRQNLLSDISEAMVKPSLKIESVCRAAVLWYDLEAMILRGEIDCPFCKVAGGRHQWQCDMRGALEMLDDYLGDSDG